MGITIGGNSCVFFLFVVFSMILAIGGFVIEASGIYLFAKTGEIKFFSLGLVIVGQVLALFGLASCCLRISKWKLLFYNICLTLVFLVDLGATIAFLVD